MILVRVRDVSGHCKIPGYDKGWFIVDSVDFGLSNKRQAASVGNDSDASDAAGLGRAEFKTLKIGKRIDPASCDLMFSGMRGETVPSVEIHVIENAQKIV